MKLEELISVIDEKGWVLIPNVYTSELIQQVKEEFNKYEHEFVKIQRSKGMADLVVNATHHTFVICRKMLELLEETTVSPLLEAYFQGKYILNTMGLSQIPAGGSVYTQKIHRDVRTFTGSLKLWINTLIMLDDSTSENGATWLLEGSHKTPDKPKLEYFYKHAIRAVGKAGDVLIFDANVWHAAGENATKNARQIITPFFSKPYIKQQLDYPRAFGPDFARTISPHLQQMLGYKSLTPISLNEFYQEDENRFYKSDQG